METKYGDDLLEQVKELPFKEATEFLAKKYNQAMECLREMLEMGIDDREMFKEKYRQEAEKWAEKELDVIKYQIMLERNTPSLIGRELLLSPLSPDECYIPPPKD